MVIIITFEKLVLPYFTFLSGKTNDYLRMKKKGITTSINNFLPFGTKGEVLDAKHIISLPFGTKSEVLDAKHIISLRTAYLVFY